MDDGDLLVGGAGAEVGEDLGEDGAEVDGAEVEGEGAGFEAGEGQEVFDQEGEPVGVFFDSQEEAVEDGGVGFGSVEEGFDVAFDHGEGGAEFVADVGDEFGAGAFEEFESAEVMEHEEGAVVLAGGVGEEGTADFEVALGGAGEVQFEDSGLAVGEEAVGELLDLVLAEGFDDGAALDVGGEVEEAGEGVIDHADAAVGVKEEDALDHALEEGLLLGGGPGGMEAVFLLCSAEFGFPEAEGGLEPGEGASVGPGEGEAGGGGEDEESGPHGGRGRWGRRVGRGCRVRGGEDQSRNR